MKRVSLYNAANGVLKESVLLALHAVIAIDSEKTSRQLGE